MLSLSRIHKRYAARTVLDGIDLQVPQGQTLALIGPSGCGKSTLLRIMIGLIQPDEGQVFLDGVPLATADLATVRGNFGYVIQDGGLFPHLTCRQNAALPAAYRKWPAPKIANRLQELRELTELPRDALTRYPTQLSGGQRQRVSLMRALMLDPGILLLDEPLAALDPMIRSQLQTQLKKIFRELGKTVVVVTHDLHEAAFLADEIALLRNGQLVQSGGIDELREQPCDAFVAEFIAAQQNHLLGPRGG